MGWSPFFCATTFWCSGNNDNPVARARQSDGNQWGGESNLVVKTASLTVPAGAVLTSPFVEPVLHPVFRRPADDQSMVAIGRL